MINDYDEIAGSYAKHTITGTSYLSFKNIPMLIKQYVHGVKTLDFGCGSGRSTRFLDELGFEVVGVDINETVMHEARRESGARNIPYVPIKNGRIPYENETFDFVFSSMVMCGISSIESLTMVFKEIQRVMKKTGVFIVVTASTAQYENEWLSTNTNFPQNKNLKSGDIAKIVLKNIGLELFDYYWTEDDYEKVISLTGLTILEKNHPLGDENDGYDWRTESIISPYITYVLKCS